MAYTINQLKVWPFKPNRSTPITETLDWLTDIVTAYRGDEQRISLRSKPRRGFEYFSRISGLDSQKLANILWGWQTQPFALPMWGDRCELTSSAPATSTSLQVATGGLGFTDGGFAVIFVDSSNFELVQIDVVAPTEVSLLSATAKSWSAGVSVYPIQVAFLPAGVPSRQPTSVTTEITASFACDPIQTDSNLPIVAPSVSYAGYEVVLKKANWAQPIDTTNDFDFAEVDYQTGGIARFDKYDTPKITKRFQWVLKDRLAHLEFRALIARLAGRFKSVWMPTWLGDFSLYSSELSSASSIKVKTNEFQQMVGLDPSLKTIMIVVNGAPIFKTINSVTLDTSFTTLGLTTSIGVALNQSNVSMISLIHLCRLAADRVTINHITSEVATVDLNFITVKA